MRTTGSETLVARVHRATRAVTDLPTLARTVYRTLDVPFAFACLATTDPATGLVTWASKSHPLDVGDEEWSALEYGPPDVNGFAELARRRPPVGVLSVDTGGRPEECRRHREFLAPRFGFTDELRLVLTSRGVGWGALALYRGAGEPPFTSADAARVGPVGEVLATAVQHCLFARTDAPTDQPVPAGPAVLVVDAGDRVTQSTPAAGAAVEELGGWDHGALPAGVLAVVASTRTRAAPVDTAARGTSGRWWSLRAAPLSGPDGDVVVSVEPTPRSALSRLALAAHGLTAREEDVAALVLQGADTRAIAAALHLSPHTVQDHLKSVFAKLGVSSRREMTARLVLT